MSPIQRLDREVAERPPRVSGDEPNASQWNYPLGKSAPRKRG